jgi:hypothetical protein
MAHACFQPPIASGRRSGGNANTKGRLISICRDDLERDKALFFDARNLVEAIDRLINDDNDCFVFQSLARIAVEKIDTVTAGNLSIRC